MNIIKKTDLEPVLERHPSKHNSNDTDINYWLTKNSKHDFDGNFFSEFIHSLIHQFVYRTMDHVEQSPIKKIKKNLSLNSIWVKINIIIVVVKLEN